MNNLTAALAKASPAGYGEAGTRISGAVAVVGTLFSALLGGWDVMIRALIFFMAFDFLSGILFRVFSKYYFSRGIKFKLNHEQ